MKVEATRTGFYGGKLREPGDVFDLKEGKDALGSWMRIVDGKTPTGKGRKGAESSIPPEAEDESGNVL